MERVETVLSESTQILVDSTKITSTVSRLSNSRATHGVLSTHLRRPDYDPIPYLFNALDVNNDGNRDDHVLYGTGASTFNSAFDPLIGGTLLRNDRYFTPARAPIDPDVNGLLDITLPGGGKALGVDIVDVNEAGTHYQQGGPYQVRFDANFDRVNDLDDLLIVYSYYQYGFK